MNTGDKNLNLGALSIVILTTGIGLEFKMLTAAILGGASLIGGKGSILRSIIGLIFLATILNKIHKINF